MSRAASIGRGLAPALPRARPADSVVEREARLTQEI